VTLSHAGKREKLRELGRAALPELAALEAVPQSVQRRQAALETAMAKELQDAKSEHGAEIRAYVAKSGEKPILAAMKLKSDKRAVSALLEAPHYLSGLTAEEQATLRKEWAASTAPGKEAANISKAMEVGRGAVKAARARLCESANLKEDGSDTLT
jgi:hypothetical protein